MNPSNIAELTMMGTRGHRGARGFTLIELMITCVCIAILAGVAITSYEFATVKARLGAAKACLTEHAQYMERYYTTNMKYEGANGPSCPDIGEHYAVGWVGGAAPVAGATSYAIEAVPQGRQATAETKCGTMTINQAGQKTPTGECWK